MKTKRTRLGDFTRELRRKNNITLRSFLLKSNQLEVDGLFDGYNWCQIESGFMPPPSDNVVLFVLNSVFNLTEEESEKAIEYAKDDRKNFKMISEEEFIIHYLPAFPQKVHSMDNYIKLLKEEYKQLKEKIG